MRRRSRPTRYLAVPLALLGACAPAPPPSPLPTDTQLCTERPHLGAEARWTALAGHRYRVPDGFELVSLGAWHHIHQRDAEMVGVAVTEHPLGFFAAGHPGLELLARCATRIDGRPVEIFLGRWGREDAPVYELLAEWFDPVAAGAGRLRVELHAPDLEALLDLRPVIWSVRVLSDARQDRPRHPASRSGAPLRPGGRAASRRTSCSPGPSVCASRLDTRRHGKVAAHRGRGRRMSAPRAAIPSPAPWIPTRRHAQVTAG